MTHWDIRKVNPALAVQIQHARFKRTAPCEPRTNEAYCLPYNLCWRQWDATGHKARPFSHTLPPGRWAATLPLSVGHSVWGCRRMHTVPHRTLRKGGRKHTKVIKLHQKQWMVTVRISHLGYLLGLLWLTCHTVIIAYTIQYILLSTS